MTMLKTSLKHRLSEAFLLEVNLAGGARTLGHTRIIYNFALERPQITLCSTENSSEKQHGRCSTVEVQFLNGYARLKKVSSQTARENLKGN